MRMLGLFIGVWIYRLVSGKKSDEVEITDLQPLLITLGFVAWVLCLILCVAGSAGADLWLSIAFIIGFPAALVIWGILARRKNGD